MIQGTVVTCSFSDGTGIRPIGLVPGVQADTTLRVSITMDIVNSTVKTENDLSVMLGKLIVVKESGKPNSKIKKLKKQKHINFRS